MESVERLETSIFKHISKEKTLVSAVMNPNIDNGMFNIILDIVRLCDIEFKNFEYNGKVFMIRNKTGGDEKIVKGFNPKAAIDENKYLEVYQSEENVNLKMNIDSFVMGGAAYELHSRLSDPRFKVYLPGVHDIDCEVKISLNDEYIRAGIVTPFIDVIIEDHKQNGDFLNQSSLLSVFLRHIINTCETRLTGSSPLLKYSRFMDNKHMFVNVLPQTVSENDDVLYSNIIDDVFLIKIVEDGNMLKIQIDLLLSDGVLKDSDHVLEFIFSVSSKRENTAETLSYTPFPTDKVVYIENIPVMTTPYLASSALAAGLDRSFKSTQCAFLSDISMFGGKCSQDFLRMVYIIVSDLGKENPFVNKKFKSKIVYTREGKEFFKGNNKDLMFITHKYASTFIDRFIASVKYLKICIEFSGISLIDDSNVKLGEILDDGIYKNHKTTPIISDINEIISLIKTLSTNDIVDSLEKEIESYRESRSINKRDITEMIELKKINKIKRDVGIKLNQNISIELYGGVEKTEDDIEDLDSFIFSSVNGVETLEIEGDVYEVKSRKVVNRYFYQFVLVNNWIVSFQTSLLFKN